VQQKKGICLFFSVCINISSGLGHLIVPKVSLVVFQDQQLQLLDFAASERICCRKFDSRWI